MTCNPLLKRHSFDLGLALALRGFQKASMTTKTEVVMETAPAPHSRHITLSVTGERNLPSVCLLSWVPREGGLMSCQHGVSRAWD